MKTTHRFFLPAHLSGILHQKNPGENVKIIDQELLHQWTRVLRLKNGERIVLLDNTGKEYESECIVTTKEQMVFCVKTVKDVTTEPRTKITIYQAVPKQLEKLEYVIQKGTELGATAFVPLLTERTIQRTISPQKIERLRHIAKEAAEQSERGYWPHVAEPETLKKAVDDITKMKPHELMLCTDARENKNQLREFELLIKAARGISIFIGPEGGLTSGEIDFLKQEGAQCVQLGPRVLRTETAGPAILAALFVGGLIE